MLSLSSIACLSAILGDKGLYSSANIRAVLAMFFRIFLPCETIEMFRH